MREALFTLQSFYPCLHAFAHSFNEISLALRLPARVYFRQGPASEKKHSETYVREQMYMGNSTEIIKPLDTNFFLDHSECKKVVNKMNLVASFFANSKSFFKYT